MKTIVYTYRGLIERGADYRWAQGYSAEGEHGGVLYPWMTREECYRDALSQGAKPVFVRDDRLGR